MADELVLRERAGAVEVVTINRPQKGNALSVAVLHGLEQVAADIETRYGEDDCPHAVVITGAGDRAFSAGADITELDGISVHAARAQMRLGQRIFDRIEALPLPVIAALNGHALGGGLELAMACDIRVAARTSSLGQPEITLANLPGWGGTQRLPRIVGRGVATEMILLGEAVTAERAYELRLVNRVVDDALGAAIELAQQVATRSPTAVRGAKRAIAIGLQAGLSEGLAVEADAVGVCCGTKEQHDAVNGFLKRPREGGGA
jgi:enoyl-CoA hydratase